MNKIIRVYDPPMCCSSGVCGASVNAELVRFSNDLESLRKNGIDVQRFNLSTEPAAFVAEPLVKEALTRQGNDALPLIIAEGVIVAEGRYPERAELLGMAGLESEAAAASLSQTGATANSECAPGCNCSSGTAEESAVSEAVSECGPGCNCGMSATGISRGRRIAGVAVLLVAAVLVVRAVVQERTAPAESKAAAGFAVLPPASDLAAADVAPALTTALKEIGTFADLNTLAAGSPGVFIYVPAKEGSAASAPLAPMQGAARMIEPQLRGKITLFALKAGSSDHDQIVKQMPVPGVIVIVPGGRMVPVTGDITETKLVQGFARSAQSCGSGGCGPRGCG